MVKRIFIQIQLAKYIKRDTQNENEVSLILSGPNDHFIAFIKFFKVDILLVSRFESLDLAEVLQGLL